MPICTRCNGTGFEEFFEDRYCRDACYHCGNTGKVSEEIDYHDTLMRVAGKLAYYHVCELRDYRNSDPDGEGWDFCAAENMMSGNDYFDMHVYDYMHIFGEKLSKMDIESQHLLIEWNKVKFEPKVEKKPLMALVPEAIPEAILDDDIGF